MGKGSISRISSWYRALTKDTKALVYAASFEPVVHLLLEGSASGILVQTLAKRWWDATHTFHIAEREMTVTLYDFHQMMGLRFDGPPHWCGGCRHSSESIHYFDLEAD